MSANEKALTAGKHNQGSTTSTNSTINSTKVKLIKTPKSSKYKLNRNNLTDPINSITELNKRYAVVSQGGRTLVLDEADKTIKLMTFNDFKQLYQNKVIHLQNNGQTKLGSYWLNHTNRRQYTDGIVFDPSKTNSPDEYNLWKGFDVQADPTASCRLILRHIKHVICSGESKLYQYLIQWLAKLIQEPWKMPGVAICLLSEQGAGKGILMEYLNRIMGRHYCRVTDKKHLIGQFSGHLAHSVLIFADEMTWKDSQEASGVLKGLITEPNRILEKKFADAIQVSNHTHLIIASNEDKVVPAETSDRRFCVIDVSNSKIGDNNYFDQLASEMENNGPSGLLSHLKSIDISDFNPRTFPRTKARLAQQLRSLKCVDAWIYDRLTAGTINQGWPDKLAKDDVHTTYTAWCKQHRPGDRPVSISDFSKRLKKLGVDTDTKLPSTKGSRPRAYKFPPLQTMRAEFERQFDQEIDWDG